ncbi:MAG TPA: XTP/dITP diphosphatase [Bacillota bacterium]|nr:XTP/dITP diphosphatase [Bacillota bacterium]
MKIILATNNKGKVNELRELLAGLPFEILSLADFPHLPEVVENGETFADNAAKKAKEVALATGLLALADDSGLEVDYLQGAPGVHSARFAGPQRSDQDNNAKLLHLLQHLPLEERTARFRCVIALAQPDGTIELADGSCEGKIGLTPEGAGGFGYDPLFYLPEYGCTFAQLDLKAKNQISHRGRALQKVRQRLEEMVR